MPRSVSPVIYTVIYTVIRHFHLKIRLDKDRRRKISPLLIRFKQRLRRSVIPQRIPYFTETCVSSFCEVHLFQEFPYPAISVSAAVNPVFSQPLLRNRTVCSRMADYNDPVRLYPYFHRLSFVISFVIDRIRQGFFYSCIRIIKKRFASATPSTLITCSCRTLF